LKLKQEKKSTVWCDIETQLQPWQKEVYKELGSLKKGQLSIIGCGRGTGKSYVAMSHDGTNFGLGVTGTSTFGSAWDEWEDTFVWPWNSKKSIESGKRIWGRVKVRYNSVVWEANGRQKQYATKKEVFQRKLRGTD
jgi:hypothetical protein